MTTKKVGDLVAAIPYGKEGKKRYRTVGALLSHLDNDVSKGPGFTIALDAWFNPAGLPISNDGTVYLSVYHPKVFEPALPASQSTMSSAYNDNDIPF